MASNQSYSITISNNKSEKEAIQFLLDSDNRFINPDKEDRKYIMELLEIDKRYVRAFDLIFVPHGLVTINSENIDSIILIELKTTKKRLINMPYGFFFGATESEFQLAEKLGEKYKFCFVSLHPESKGYSILDVKELDKIIKTKRIQYQINLKTKE